MTTGGNAISNDGITLTVGQPTAGGTTVATWTAPGRWDILRWEISRDGIDADAVGPMNSVLLPGETGSYEFNLQADKLYAFELIGFTLEGSTVPVTASYTPGGEEEEPPPVPGNGSTPHTGNLADPSVPDSSLTGWGTLGGATDDGTFQAVTNHDHADGALKAVADASGDDLWVYSPNTDVTAGDTMTFAVDVFVTRAGLTGRFNLEWYTASGGWVDEEDTADLPLVANEWTRVHATVVIPSGVGNSHPNPQIVGVSSGDIVLFTLADFFEGADEDPGDPDPDPPTSDGTQRAVLGSWGAVTWGDEFNYTGPLNPAKWTAYDGPGHDGNGVRSPAAFSVNGDYARCHGNPTGTTGGCTYDGYSSVRHRVEVRARMAADGTGSGEQYHPVLIMWPDSDEWPQGGEYDFAESDIGDTRMGAFMHHPSDDSSDQDYFESGVMDLTQWHNYAFETSSTGLRGWIDGVPFFTDTDPNAFPPPGPMHITWQLDNFGGTSHKGANLDIMWVRGYAAPS